MRARNMLFSGESLTRLNVGGAGDRWRLANTFTPKVFQGGERAQQRQFPSCHGAHVVRPGSVSVRDHVECVYGPHVQKRRRVVWKRQGEAFNHMTHHNHHKIDLFLHKIESFICEVQCKTRFLCCMLIGGASRCCRC